MTVVTESPGRLDSMLSDDKRWYVFGSGDAEERFMRVSTALDLVGEKDGYVRWAAGLAADAAVDNLPTILRATRTKECARTHNKCKHDYRIQCVDCPCRACLPCVRHWVANRHYYETIRRAEEGTRVHDVAEHWVQYDAQLPPHADDIAVYVKRWLEWAQDHGLTPESWEMTEATVVNRAHGYAGTLDGILTIHADATPAAGKLVAQILSVPPSQAAGRSVRVLADTKSREKEEAKLFVDNALQLAAYRMAEVVRLRDGREEPLPQTDGAIIVQVRPDGYLCRPVVADATTFEAFLSALTFAKWHVAFATASVSSRSFKVPAEPKPAKKAPAARKTPAKKALAEPVQVELIPVGGATRPIRDVAAQQSATLASMRRPLERPPHPDSPFHDNIPF